MDFKLKGQSIALWTWPIVSILHFYSQIKSLDAQSEGIWQTINIMHCFCMPSSAADISLVLCYRCCFVLSHREHEIHCTKHLHIKKRTSTSVYIYVISQSSNFLCMFYEEMHHNPLRWHYVKSILPLQFIRLHYLHKTLHLNYVPYVKGTNTHTDTHTLTGLHQRLQFNGVVSINCKRKWHSTFDHCPLLVWREIHRAREFSDLFFFCFNVLHFVPCVKSLMGTLEQNRVAITVINTFSFLEWKEENRSCCID